MLSLFNANEKLAQGFCTYLQSKQVKNTLQDSINELIIWKMNPLVVPVSFVKFKAHFCLRNEQWISNENFSVLGQIEIFE